MGGRDSCSNLDGCGSICRSYGGWFTCFVLCCRSVESPWAVAVAAGKTKVWDFSFDLGNARTFLNAGLVYMVFEVAIRGCDQQFIQRYLSCKNDREAKLSSIFSALVACWLLYCFYGWCISFAYYQEFTTKLPADIKVNEVFLTLFSRVAFGCQGLIVARFTPRL